MPVRVRTSDHSQTAHLELEVSLHLAGGDVELEGVVHLPVRVGEADRAAIVCGGNGDGSALTSLVRVAARRGLLGLGHALHADQLVLRLLRLHAVHGEASLDVVKKTEVLVRRIDLHNILESGGVVDISADLVVHLDVAAHHNQDGLAAGQRVLKAVAQDERERKALAQLVGSRRGTRGPLQCVCSVCEVRWVNGIRIESTHTYISTRRMMHPSHAFMNTLSLTPFSHTHTHTHTHTYLSAQFVKHPVLGRVQALHVLLGTSGHDEELV
jgi:hypothetical protein